MRKIAATVALTLAAMAGPGLTTAEPTVAAGAAPSKPGVSVVSAWGGATEAPQLVRASLPGTSQASAISGAQLWVRRYTGSGNVTSDDDLGRSVAVSPSGDTIFVTGYSTGDTQDYATIAYNAATGAQLWLKRYNGPAGSDDQAYSVAVSPDGSAVFVTGFSTGATSGDDYVTVAYNAATGAQLWVRRYNGPGNGTDHAGSVAVSPGGDTVFVTGYSDGGATTRYDYATVAYNAATGAQLWVNRYDGGSASHGGDAVSVAVSPGGGTVYVTGFSPGATSGDDYVTVACNAATGATLWVRRYNGSGNSTDDPVSVAVSPDGGTVYVTGRSIGSGSGDDYVTVAYNAATGATLWVRRYNGPANSTDAAYWVAVGSSTGTVFVTGISYGATSGADILTVAYSG